MSQPPIYSPTILQIPRRNRDPPPSYNSVMRMSLPMVHGQSTNPNPIHILMSRYNNVQPSAPFYYHPPPPPTYSESEFGFVGRRNRHPSLLNFECAPSHFSRDPQLTNCRNCGFVSLTVTENRYTRHAHAACVLMCVLGCLLCCWLPYLVNTSTSNKQTKIPTYTLT